LVVVENLTKLVHDPIEARVFLPKLKPGVKAAKERASLPEVREIGQRALDVIDHAMGGHQDGDSTTMSAIERTQPHDVSAFLEKHIKINGGLVDPSGDADIWSLAKQYISNMVAEDVNQREIERVAGCIEPYLEPLMDDGKAAAVA